MGSLCRAGIVFPTGSLYGVCECCFSFDCMLFLTFWVFMTRPDS